MSQQQVQFRRGDWVEIRPFSEICRTLDSDGMLNGLPYMPEMAGLCGKRIKIHNRADHIEADSFGMRKMEDAVLLEDVRCNGAHHGNCQRGCMILWRSAWLKPVAVDKSTMDKSPATVPKACLKVDNPQHSFDWMTNRNGRYICQCTQLQNITMPLHFLDIRQYVKNIYWGILNPGEQFQILGRHLAIKLRNNLYKSRSTKLPSPANEFMQFSPGEWVEVKNIQEIEQTLDPLSKNRGLLFMNEMRKHCGHKYQVEAPINRIINDTDGKMVNMKNTVVLKNVVCDGSCHFGCPRQSWLFWRVEWLRKIPGAQGTQIS
jgi:hypothetical protein